MNVNYKAGIIFFLFILFGIFGLAKSSLADCTGSGTNWNCSPGSSVSQIQSAINSSNGGATITLANGNYSWSSSISLNGKNGFTLTCASIGGCDVTTSGTVFLLSEASDTPVSNLLRISGFNFHGSNAGNGVMWFEGDRSVAKLRVDNNKFTYTGGVGVFIGHTQSTHKIRGVIDHNTFLGSTSYQAIAVLGAGDNDWVSGLQGSADNLFVEDNTMNFDSDPGITTCIDTWHGGAVVFRHNTMHNCRAGVHGSCHNGPANFEIYDNTIQTATGYRMIHHQGSGEFMAFNNNLAPGTDTDYIALLYYRSSNPNPESCGTCDGTQSIDGNRTPTTTYYGYPCWKQPGRDVNATLRPVYLWNNYNTSGNETKINIESAGGTDYNSYHLVANRDYYEAVSKSAQTSPTSPFNGTSGMGFGTLANRPTTCTPTSEALDAGHGGVGYFATDVGSQGTLYNCSATNTWSVYYTPYTYPHPLVSGSTPPTDTTAPSVPQGFSVQ